MAVVTFDGPNRLIIVDHGVTAMDVKSELYSEWKRWVPISDNSKYLQAMRTVAGDPVSGSKSVSPYFFLMNGWFIRPHEDDHELIFEGNLYGEAGAPMFTPTLGGYTVTAIVERSVNSLTEYLSGSGLSANELAQLRDALGIDGTKIPATGGQVQSLEANLLRALGLMNENAFSDTLQFDGFGQVVGMRVRCYNSSANVSAARDVGDGGDYFTGLVATYLVEAVYSGEGRLKTYLMTLQP